jgi:hypothetical protein
VLGLLVLQRLDHLERTADPELAGRVRAGVLDRLIVGTCDEKQKEEGEKEVSGGSRKTRKRGRTNP